MTRSSVAISICLALFTAHPAAAGLAQPPEPLAVLQAAASPSSNAAFTLLYPGESGRGPTLRIAVRTPTSPSPETITQPDSNAFSPDWLNNKTLLFLSDRTGVPQLYSSRIGTQGDPLRLSHSRNGVRAFLPSPSGRRIALVEDASGQRDTSLAKAAWQQVGPSSKQERLAVVVLTLGTSGTPTGRGRSIVTEAGEWRPPVSPLSRSRPPLAWSLSQKREILLGFHVAESGSTVVKCLYPPSVASKFDPLELDFTATAMEPLRGGVVVVGFSKEGTRRAAILEWKSQWVLRELLTGDAPGIEAGLPDEPDAQPALFTSRYSIWHLSASLRVVNKGRPVTLDLPQSPFRVWDAWPSAWGQAATATLFLPDGSSLAIQLGGGQQARPATIIRIAGQRGDTSKQSLGQSPSPGLLVGHSCSSSAVLLLLLQSLTSAETSLTVPACGCGALREALARAGRDYSQILWLGPATSDAVEHLHTGSMQTRRPITWVRWLPDIGGAATALQCPTSAKCLVGPAGELGMPDLELIQELRSLLRAPPLSPSSARAQ